MIDPTSRRFNLLISISPNPVGMKFLALALIVVSSLTTMGQEISGIGVALGKNGDEFIINGVLPNSPAGLSKALHKGDRIIAIGQGDGPLIDITGSQLTEVVGMIRGPKGTPIQLTVVPAGKDDSESNVVKLVRGELKGIRAETPIGITPFTLQLIGLGIGLIKPL